MVLNQLIRGKGEGMIVLSKLLIVPLKYTLQLTEKVIRNALPSTRRKKANYPEDHMPTDLAYLQNTFNIPWVKSDSSII